MNVLELENICNSDEEYKTELIEHTKKSEF